MGIPVNGSVYILGDNKSVLCYTSIPDSTLKRSPRASCITLFLRELNEISGVWDMSIHTRSRQVCFQDTTAW